MTYSKDNLRQIFQQPFNQEGWQNMLQHYFHATELKAEREHIDDTPDDEKGYYLGAIDTTDNYRIGLFYYQIQHGNVARKRVGLRNLVKSFINPNWGEFDSALVVFDSARILLQNVLLTSLVKATTITILLLGVSMSCSVMVFRLRTSRMPSQWSV